MLRLVVTLHFCLGALEATGRNPVPDLPAPRFAEVAPMPRARAAAAAATPPGYPPAPKGFRWEQYPGGIWGLVQDGVAVPKARPAPPGAACTPAG